MADLISNLEVEVLAEVENLRTLRSQVLISMRWTGAYTTDVGLAIWEINEDGSLDTGDWLRQHWKTQ